MRPFFAFFIVFLLGLTPFLLPAGSKPPLIIPQQWTGMDLVSGKEKVLKLSQGKKGTVITFLSARCPCSLSHESSLDALAKKYTPLGFQFIGIHSNSDEKDEASRQHFRDSQLSFPVLQDKDSKLANLYDAYKTPHVYLQDPRGALLFQGGIDDSNTALRAKRFYLKEALEAVHNGQPPPLKEGRVLGCVIQRSIK